MQGTAEVTQPPQCVVRATLSDSAAGREGRHDACVDYGKIWKMIDTSALCTVMAMVGAAGQLCRHPHDRIVGVCLMIRGCVSHDFVCCMNYVALCCMNFVGFTVLVYITLP